MKLRALITAGVAVLLVGCGGQHADQMSPVPKGEGNIPIGKAKNCVSEGGRAVIYRSDGTQYQTNLVDGVIFAPKSPNGLTRIELYPNNAKLNRIAITLEAGDEQTNIARLWPMPKNFTLRIIDIACAIQDGTVFHVGDQVPLGIKVRALSSSTHYMPTVFVSGGVGSLDDEQNFIATHVGSGQITIRVGNVSKSVNISVE